MMLGLAPSPTLAVVSPAARGTLAVIAHRTLPLHARPALVAVNLLVAIHPVAANDFQLLLVDETRPQKNGRENHERRHQLASPGHGFLLRC